MSNNLACNINFFLYTRAVLGYYHDFRTYKQIRWPVRFYCFLICVNIIFGINYFYNTEGYPVVIIYVLSVEYFLYMFISVVQGNKFLLQYYKKTPLIDSSANTYKSMRVQLIGFTYLMFLAKLCGYLYGTIIYWGMDVWDHWFALSEFMTWYTVLMGRSPLLFVFALLYSRVKMMRQTLERNNFDCRNQGKHHPRRYIQMYEAIMDGLEKCERSWKVQHFILVLFSTLYSLTGSYCAIYFFKKDVFLVISNWEFLWFLVEILMACSPLFLSAVLADLVSMEIQEMLSIILERRMACQNERDYQEIQKLFQFVHNNPFEYSLWRVVQLNVRTMLAFFSFSITTTIAILQIHEWSY